MKKRNLLLKRMIAGVAMGCTVFALTGCGEDADDDDGRGSVKDRQEKEAEPTEEPEPTKEAEPEPTAEPMEEPTPTEEPTPEPTEAPAGHQGYVAPTELSDSIYDYQISINGEIVQLPLYVEDLLAQGWEVKSNLSDLGTGMRPSTYDLYYFTKGDTQIYADVMNWDVNERPAGECVINGITIERNDAKDAEVELPGGINWNTSTTEDVMAAYGTPSYENETSSLYFMRYEEGTRNEVEVRFEVESGQIDKISLDNFTEPEDFVQGAVSTDVPELTAMYQAPTAMSDDPADFIIEVDGALYQLPCPVSEFVNNGWEVVDGKSEESIEGRGSGKVTLRKNNFEFWTYVRNYDDNATAVENSFVTDFQLRDHDANVSVKIAGGVEYHMDQDEAMKILEPMGYEFEEGTIEGSGYLILKYESFKKYEIYVNNGIIKDIAVVNQLKRDELYK